MVAIGGWLGISYDDKETSRIASILYGAGGGLIVDEVGLLLTLGNYWTGLTYAFLVVFLAFIVVLLFFYRYGALIVEELSEFVRSKLSFYLGILLFAVSVAFIIQTENSIVTAIASVIAVIAIILIMIFLFRQFTKVSKTKSFGTLLIEKLI